MSTPPANASASEPWYRAFTSLPNLNLFRASMSDQPFGKRYGPDGGYMGAAGSPYAANAYVHQQPMPADPYPDFWAQGQKTATATAAAVPPGMMPGGFGCFQQSDPSLHVPPNPPPGIPGQPQLDQHANPLVGDPAQNLPHQPFPTAAAPPDMQQMMAALVQSTLATQQALQGFV
eukprot:TRINITY_DN73765_c0_g1_i1.p1 TRINITY_DN73765_c0_g1~~TRINITY_DN73765_c0_g1_i1.p1  ORF type:complete len:175 (-),score=38.46 TRINITY_DN73765_c0_g1_i1:958-1482(-)